MPRESSTKKVTYTLVGKLKFKKPLETSVGQETMTDYYQTFND